MEGNFAEQTRALFGRDARGAYLLSTYKAVFSLTERHEFSKAHAMLDAAIFGADPAGAYTTFKVPLHCLRILTMILRGEHEKGARGFAEVLNALLFEIAIRLPAGELTSAEATSYAVQWATNDERVVGVLRRLNEIGEYYKAWSNFATGLLNRDPTQAYYLLNAAYEGRRAAIGPNDDESLLAAHKLVFALRALGRCPVALRLGRYVFDQRRRKYGFAHVLTLRSANALAGVLFECGEKEAARALMHQTVAASINLSGKDDEQTRIFQNNLIQMSR
jgi:hypothetical protein